MKTALISLLICTFAFTNLLAQKAPLGRSESNPLFEQYLQKSKSKTLDVEYMNGIELGAIPPPSTLYYGKKQSAGSPKSFDSYYDLRDHGLVTPVKPQSNNGCWAYASIGSVESRWLKLGLGTWDLSENNLKYCHGFVPDRSYWGNHWMSTAYFSRRSGPLAEADDPYPGGTSIPGDCPTGKTPLAYIDAAYYLPNDMDVIKQSVLDYGAIYTMMYISSSFLNTSDYTYFYNGSPRVNHAVDIVGWDDNKSTAGGTGAWICKNSYGPNWGLNGYFYISYNDSSVLDYNAVWTTRLEMDENTNILGYDELGHYYSITYGTETGAALLKYTASEKMRIEKLGTYAVAANESIQMSIYQNYEGGNLSGLLATLPLVNCEWPGYYTQDLTNPIAIDAESEFYIKVVYNTPGYTYPIPYECFISGYSDPVIENGVCWISGDGTDGSWYAVGASNPSWQIDLCAKVYTSTMPAPYILQQSENTVVCMNDSTALNISVLGNNYSLQWQKNRSDISGATDSILTFPQANLSDTGIYRCLAFTDFDTVYSREVILDVLAAPEVELNFYAAICEEAEPILLKGGMPEGGNYSGAGVSNNFFDPSISGSGNQLIVYEYSNNKGCSDTAQAYLEVLSTPTSFVCGNNLSDPRDGKSYSTIEIDGQCWMKENLNYGTQINGGANQANNGIPEKYCYNNQSDTCTKYGALYQWDEIMAWQNNEGCTGICPCGWHIPSKQEWESLFLSIADGSATAGEHLIIDGYTGFDLFMGGAAFGRNNFIRKGTYTELWTSSAADAIKAYSMHFGLRKPSANERKSGHQSAFYLRCLKNN